MSGSYRTIVADPPWRYGKFNNGSNARIGFKGKAPQPLPYRSLSVAEICALPVADLAGEDAHLYLWATNRYLHDAFHVAEAWRFRFSQVLVWCKAPGPQGLGGAFASTTEYVLFCRRGRLATSGCQPSTWFDWRRTLEHSRKPEHFIDLVEQVSPGPYLELFSRRHRLGWDVWGDQVESSLVLPGAGRAPTTAG